jgi:hypothetical protein
MDIASDDVECGFNADLVTKKTTGEGFSNHPESVMMDAH